MWIMTNKGFISAVAHREKKNMLMVRARAPGHLEAVLGVAPKDVEKTDDADYAYRVVIGRSAFKVAIDRMTDAIDYDNFKNSVEDNNLHDAYMDVWTAMYRYQSRERTKLPKMPGLQRGTVGDQMRARRGRGVRQKG